MERADNLWELSEMNVLDERELRAELAHRPEGELERRKHDKEQRLPRRAIGGGHPRPWARGR